MTRIGGAPRPLASPRSVDFGTSRETELHRGRLTISAPLLCRLNVRELNNEYKFRRGHEITFSSEGNALWRSVRVFLCVCLAGCSEAVPARRGCLKAVDPTLVSEGRCPHVSRTAERFV
ncbi:hypothetical protein RR46_03769 [Papilio xuthus]|uniref:Uncharacterized protein n=1 Tax=Papilio xuthus TaxID=66420 RepID=A0A194Q324_PAPXU|nr:hypothetical protein RR46_03769 [Papilio xuthus]